MARPTIADVRALALALPETVERPTDGAPAFYVRKALYARVLDDERIAVKVTLDQRDELLEARPDVFSVTPQVMAHPLVVVSLAAITRAMLDDVLFEAWRQSAPPAITRHPAGQRAASSAGRAASPSTSRPASPAKRPKAPRARRDRR